MLDGIDAAAEAGFAPVKINAVVAAGRQRRRDRRPRPPFGGDGRRGALHRVHAVDADGWSIDQVVPGRRDRRRDRRRVPARAGAEANYRGEAAERWRYLDGGGEVGVIPSVSKPFCGDCDRVRLTAEGQFLTCLFAASGLDLRGPMRAGASDDDLRDLIVGCWTKRSDRYSEQRSELTIRPRKHVQMFQVGG